MPPITWFLSKNCIGDKSATLSSLAVQRAVYFFPPVVDLAHLYKNWIFFKAFFYTEKLAEISFKKTGTLVHVGSWKPPIIYSLFLVHPKRWWKSPSTSTGSFSAEAGVVETHFVYISESWTKNSCVYTTLNEILVVYIIGINMHPYVMVYHNPHITG